MMAKRSDRFCSIRTCTAALAALAVGFAPTAVAAEGAAPWQLQITQLPDVPVSMTGGEDNDPRDLRITTRDGRTFELADCDSGLCAEEVISRSRPERKPADALADGVIAEGTRNIGSAWLAEPTRRYNHGVLGDDVEAGALIVTDHLGARHRLDLGLGAVFEDLQPRLADLDQDGADEIVMVKSYLDRGAALAIAELRNDGLVIEAETRPIGRPHRWLNPAGIADFDGDGAPEVAIVVTPHIGGRLEIWKLRDHALKRIAQADGFSNHVIGSRDLAMSIAADLDGDGRADLAVPGNDRRSIRMMHLGPGGLSEFASVALPARANTSMFSFLRAGAKRPFMIVGMDNGQLAIIH